MFGGKSKKELRTLKRVVRNRLKDINLVEPLLPLMSAQKRGWLLGQKEVYDEMLGILEGEIVILEPVE